jgi:hypothetical protein
MIPCLLQNQWQQFVVHPYLGPQGGPSAASQNFVSQNKSCLCWYTNTWALKGAIRQLIQ